MSEDTAHSVRIERTGVGQYVVHNVRGGSMTLGTGEDDSFTPVELLPAAGPRRRVHRDLPAGPDGDRAREALPRSLQQSHDRLCTVSRTVELGSLVTIV